MSGEKRLSKVDTFNIRILPGDIFLTRSRSFLGKLIRFFQRDLGEAKTIYNHVGLFLNDSTLYHAVSIEALKRVRYGRFYSFYHNDSSKVTIVRYKHYNKEDRAKVVAKALTYKGLVYGFAKLPAHILRWILGPKFGKFLVKRMLFLDAVPICSWIVAHSSKEGRLSFGVDPDVCQPDDIGDYFMNNPKDFEVIVELVKI